eukprot:403375526
MKREHRFMILKVVEDIENVVVDQIGARYATFEDFKQQIPQDEPRYAVFEIEFVGNAGNNDSKILFILYVPDVSNSNLKFIYATSKDAVRKKVQPFHKELQVNDWNDLDEETFFKYFKH